METECVIQQGAFKLWVIVNARDEGLAWSGSAWAPHVGGLPLGRVQVSNFESEAEAASMAREQGLTVCEGNSFLGWLHQMLSRARQ